MRNYSSMLVVVGSLSLMTTLGLAWCLAGVRVSAFMKRQRSVMSAQLGPSGRLLSAASKARHVRQQGHGSEVDSESQLLPAFVEGGQRLSEAGRL